ncbi:MAG TPA: DUF4870 domain-containing protein [Vicinamibacterales bacterium]|nr:DUF4870 domain-containing protein [Vicinamibacterales bacterium]
MPNGATGRKTSTGLDANVAAALSYFLGFVTGIIFLVAEKDDRFVRFHAMQSTILFLGLVGIDIVINVVPILGALVVIFLVIPVSAVLWLLLMFEAYRGEEFRLPVIGRIAAERI